MLSGDLAARLSASLQIPVGTVQDAGKALRAAGLLSRKGRGPRSGAQMTAADVVNWTLALIIDKPRGSDVAELVDRCRNLRAVSLHRPGLDGLNGFFSATPGLALASILCGLQPGGSILEWEAGEPAKITATISTLGDSVLTSFWPANDDPAKGVQTGMQIFGKDYNEDAPVARSVTLRRVWFEQMAEALCRP